MGDDDDDDDFGFDDHELDDLPAQTLDQLETTAIAATQRGPSASTQVDVAALLARIKTLEQEKHRLSTSLESAAAEATRKAGEVDNLRRRADQTSRATELRIQHQQREHGETTAKFAAERDALLRQLEQTKTSIAFDEHDRHDEQMRRPRRTVPTRPKLPAPALAPPTRSPAGTPRKTHKTLPPGDGFDDDDIITLSPSKRRDGKKAATPKQPGKRKRQVAHDSPVPTLQLSEPRDKGKASVPEATLAKSTPHLHLLRALWKDDRRFALLHRLLSHRCSNGSDRILEALAQHAFPSQPQKRLSSIVYDAFATTAPSDVHELALCICRIFSDVWERCLRERHYAPMYLSIDALLYTLACEPAKTAVQVIERILPLVVESVKVVAVPVYEARNRNEKKTFFLFTPGYQSMVSEIDVQTCLELLYLLATSCVSEPTDNTLSLFWRNMPLDFVLLLLLKEQPVSSMIAILRVLSTSALSNSLGPIVSDELEKQVDSESSLISRLTNLFSETIAPIPNPRGSSPEALSEARIWQVRLKILDVLTHFSVLEYGSAALVQHSLCIGRLIKYLNYCVASLYTQPLSPTQDYKVASINAAMKLLSHLATSTPGFSIKSKLNETLGGLHAYYVALTRLAFSDGLVLEAGIEQEVVDMAHDILDDGLSPEEGDALAEVFPSGSTV